MFELNKLNDPSVQAIFQNYKFLNQQFKGDWISGGIYLSKKLLGNLREGSDIFFDESKDLRTELEFYNKTNTKRWNLVEIKSKGRDPFEFMESLILLLQPFLEKSLCKSDLESLRSEINQARSFLMSEKPFKQPIYFFLGKITNQIKLPDLIIGRDLFNVFWIKEKKIETITSQFSYIPWSASFYNQEKKKGALFIGLVDNLELTNKAIIDKLDNQHFNISYPGVLLPGLTVIHWMKEFVKIYPQMIFKKIN